MHILLIFYFSLPHIFSFIFFFYYLIFTIIYFVLPRLLSLQVLEANVYFERSRPISHRVVEVIIYFARPRPISLRAVEVIIYFARPRSISLPALEVIIYFARGRWVNWVQPLPCRLFHYCTFVLKYRRTNPRLPGFLNFRSISKPPTSLKPSQQIMPASGTCYSQFPHMLQHQGVLFTSFFSHYLLISLSGSKIGLLLTDIIYQHSPLWQLYYYTASVNSNG